MSDASVPSPLARWWGELRARVVRAPGGSPAPLEADARGRALERLRTHPWPAGLLRILDRLGEPDVPAYLVGGTVRDVALGRDPGQPFDVATPLPPTVVAGRFERVEPIGLRHGTLLVIEPGLLVECTTFRRDASYTDARHPDRVEFTRRLEEDLQRRDFTVNAIAFDPRTARLVDPHEGCDDLAHRRLRAVGDPLSRFHEDALRPLRAARLAAALEFEVEPATRAAMGAITARAGRVAMERVRMEWSKLLGAPAPSTGIELLREAGLLELWAPELARCYGVIQNRHHAYDVYEHSVRTCDAAPAGKPRVRWAALLHDIGKPDTRVVRDGDATFYGHAEVGATLADRLLERFRMSNDERAAIVHLVREHMFDYRREWSDAALRRWLRRVGVDAVADLFDLRIADSLGNGTRTGFPTQLEELRARIETLLARDQALTVRRLALDGEDVMRALGIPPGPRVGEALEALLEVVLEHPERNHRETLLEELDRWASQRGAAHREA